MVFKMKYWVPSPPWHFSKSYYRPRHVLAAQKAGVSWRHHLHSLWLGKEKQSYLASQHNNANSLAIHDHHNTKPWDTQANCSIITLLFVFMATKAISHRGWLQQTDLLFVMHGHTGPQPPRLITAQQTFHLLCMATQALSHRGRLQHNGPFSCYAWPHRPVCVVKSFRKSLVLKPPFHNFLLIPIEGHEDCLPSSQIEQISCSRLFRWRGHSTKIWQQHVDRKSKSLNRFFEEFLP